MRDSHAIVGDQIAVPCTFIRGGSSRGAFFRGADLPDDADARERFVLRVYGSPDGRQIDGLGGADPLTSKVGVLDPSTSEDADVDHTSGQGGIEEPHVFFVGNCGNMLAGAAVFAVDNGLVTPTEPSTTVRLYVTNVEQIVTASVPTIGRRAACEGDLAIPGVPGTGAAITLDFGDCAGAVTGSLLPSGRVRDQIDVPGHGVVQASIVDATTPFVYVDARSLGTTADLTPEQILGDDALMSALEHIRSEAAVRCGLVASAELATAESPSIPRVTLVGPPTSEDADVTARQMAMQRPHKAYAVTNAACTAVASQLPGTIVHELAQPQQDGELRIAHPSGVLTVRANVTIEPDGPRIHSAAILRTARTIMVGQVLVPRSLFDDDQAVDR